MNDGTAIIKVVGSGELTGDDKIATIAPGRIYTKNDSRYILYEIEDENENHLIVKYLLKLTGNSLEMTKTVMGQKTKIVYSPGQATETEYNSPFGSLLLTFRTTAFYITEKEDFLTMQLKYKICMGEDVLSKNELFIEIKNQE